MRSWCFLALCTAQAFFGGGGVFWSSRALASSAGVAAPVEGPLAVLALASEEDDDLLARLAAAMNAHMESSGRIEVVGADRLARLLSRGGASLRARETLERVRGLFQQGYLQSYSFEYQKALATLEAVTKGLERLPSDPERWKIWVKTKIFEGICRAGIKDEDAALQSFAAVLRTRPELELSRSEYSPRTIVLWEQARKRLQGLDTGQLAIESDPPGAAVYLDGKEAGRTPFIGRFHRGVYHLQVIHEGTGGAVRWVRVGKKPSRLRFQLAFEGALVLGSVHPLVRLPRGQELLPDHWWPWLGDRLGLRLLVVVRRAGDAGRSYLSAALVDLERGRRLREASLEIAGTGDEELRRAAADLADFLATGEASPRLKVEKIAAGSPLAGDWAGQRVPRLPVHYAQRPWYRSWWPYAIASGAFLTVGLGSHLATDHYRREADNAVTKVGRDSATEQADTWRGMAIAGYLLAGTAAAAALIATVTYEPQEVFPALLPAPEGGVGGAGLIWVGRF